MTALGAVAVLIGVWSTPVIQIPMARISQAMIEVEGSLIQKQDSKNTSIGSRVELWQLAVHVIPESPWIGYGGKQKEKMIQEWGEDRKSETVKSLRHMHNQYLDDFVEHGVLGLGSGLVYLLVLLFLAVWLIRKKQSFAGWTLGGVGFMHMTASLTNVNFAHNYYATVMSIVVALAMESAKGSQGAECPVLPGPTNCAQQ